MILGLTAASVLACFVLFPGRRLPLAFTLGTGIGRQALQSRIDALEERAIKRAPFADEERAFLEDFYRTLATGGKLSLLAYQTGRLMDHYLDGPGTDYRLSPEIFTDNAKVKAQAEGLRKRASSLPCRAGTKLDAPRFYMPDPSKIHSRFGLYWGTLTLSRTRASDGGCTSTFRAEVPWRWPAYPELEQKYGTPHAESFPLSNLGCLLFGRKHALYIDNGLSEYLTQVGLAKPFIAFAEWTD